MNQVLLGLIIGGNIESRVDWNAAGKGYFRARHLQLFIHQTEPAANGLDLADKPYRFRTALYHVHVAGEFGSPVFLLYPDITAEPYPHVDAHSVLGIGLLLDRFGADGRRCDLGWRWTRRVRRNEYGRRRGLLGNQANSWIGRRRS